MSDILIKDIQIPKDGRRIALFIDKDGEVTVYEGVEFSRFTDAIELPTPHGHLKDWEKIKEIFSKYLPNVDDDTNALLCEVMTDIGMNAPTILEASK